MADNTKNQFGQCHCYPIYFIRIRPEVFSNILKITIGRPLPHINQFLKFLLSLKKFKRLFSQIIDYNTVPDHSNAMKYKSLILVRKSYQDL